MEDWQKGGFGIYVHWPFCSAKCPYCDFNSHVRQAVDQTRWAKGLVKEIKFGADLTKGRKVDTIFFGGGTPSLMAPDTVAAIIDAVKTSWPISNDLEVSLEANPTSVEAEKFSGFADAGVNRLSMGVQALNDVDLRRLGRMHSAKEAKQAFDVAKRYFDRVSFDLIYARQDQSLEDWRDELNEAMTMAVDHLSLYQLTIEPQTRFGELYKKGKLGGLPPDETAADMFSLTQELTTKAGMPAYEISNHCRNDSYSRHNLIYWRYGDYLGVGPGAHGRLTLSGTKTAFVSPSNPEKWLEQIEGNVTANLTDEVLSRSDQASEYLLMSLRLAEGSDLERFALLNGKELNQSKIVSLEELDLLVQNENRIVATSSGRIVLNSILATLLG